MTNREFLNAIANNETLTDEIREHATAEIAKMDAANEKRKNKVSKKAEENAPLIAQIVDEILGTEAKTASDVAEVLGVSVQKASSLLRTIVANGQAVATDVKIPKKGTQKAYTKVEA
jgi:predicted HTH transcriptional regulator